VAVDPARAKAIALGLAGGATRCDLTTADEPILIAAHHRAGLIRREKHVVLTRRQIVPNQ
jgi:hypothetical protein